MRIRSVSSKTPGRLNLTSGWCLLFLTKAEELFSTFWVSSTEQLVHVTTHACAQSNLTNLIEKIFVLFITIRTSSDAWVREQHLTNTVILSGLWDQGFTLHLHEKPPSVMNDHGGWRHALTRRAADPSEPPRGPDTVRWWLPALAADSRLAETFQMLNLISNNIPSASRQTHFKLE